MGAPVIHCQFQIANFKITALAAPIPDCKFQIANFRFQISDLKLPISNFKLRFLAGPIPNFKFQISNFKSLFLAALLASTLPALAQNSPPAYAVIPRDAVNYAGPGRDASHDFLASEIKIGFLAPLTGPDQNEGKALLLAVQLAIEDEAATPLPQGRRLAIVPRDQNGPWGHASNEVVHLVYEDQAVAIVTSLDGGSAHLAEQIGNKIGIPVLTLSTDPTTTQINLPWIFRLGPTDTQQARAFARDIYLVRKLKQVVLVTENDHDGRVGGEEFQKAARESNAPPVIQLAVDPADLRPDSVVNQIAAQKPDALVLWTKYETAAALLPQLRHALPATAVYLCREAAQGRFDPNTWILTSRATPSPLRHSFENRYRARVGTPPTMASAQAYDAVRILAAALRRSGPNRARLRDALAELSGYTGASGVISFDHAGNDLSDVTLVTLP
jgi:branched-chain amino acid transport system substrate-binding protein